jgi:hypothetical protein
MSASSEALMNLRSLLALWCGVRVPVTRAAYIATGLGLAVFKYAVEAGVIWALTGNILTPLDFLNPSLAGRQAALADGPDWLRWALFAWNLPFVWIALSMSVRRAAGVGQPPWLGLAVLMPVAGLAVMLGLCLDRELGHGRHPRAQRPINADGPHPLHAPMPKIRLRRRRRGVCTSRLRAHRRGSDHLRRWLRRRLRRLHLWRPGRLLGGPARRRRTDVRAPGRHELGAAVASEWKDLRMAPAAEGDRGEELVPVVAHRVVRDDTRDALARHNGRARLVCLRLRHRRVHPIPVVIQLRRTLIQKPTGPPAADERPVGLSERGALAARGGVVGDLGLQVLGRQQ